MRLFYFATPATSVTLIVSFSPKEVGGFGRQLTRVRPDGAWRGAGRSSQLPLPSQSPSLGVIKVSQRRAKPHPASPLLSLPRARAGLGGPLLSGDEAKYPAAGTRRPPGLLMQVGGGTRAQPARTCGYGFPARAPSPGSAAGRRACPRNPVRARLCCPEMSGKKGGRDESPRTKSSGRPRGMQKGRVAAPRRVGSRSDQVCCDLDKLSGPSSPAS